MALTKTYQYYLAQFELTNSRNGFVDGATYTDVHAHLPALHLLIVISIAAAGLFIVNIWRRGWVFPIIAVGLWGFISIVVGTIYPAVIQKFQVQPNEFTREAAVHQAQHRGDARRVRPRQRSRPSSSATTRSSPPADTTAAQADPRQRAALRSADGTGRRSSDAGDHAVLLLHRRRRRPLQDRRRELEADPRVGARARPRAPARQLVDEPAPRVHARLRRGRRGRPTRSNVDQPELRAPGHPAHGRAQARPAVHRRLLRRGPRRLRVVDTKVAEQEATSGGNTKATTVPGQGRREGVEPAAQGGARAAVRRLEPLVSGQVDQQLAGHLHPRRHSNGCRRSPRSSSSTPIRTR